MARVCPAALTIVFVLSMATASKAQCKPEEVALLLANDGGKNDRFGYSVAIDGDLAVFGAPGGVPGNGSLGSAYVFALDDGVWSQRAHLLASDGLTGDLFGHCVAIQGETILVGAPGDTTPAGHQAGSVYVFTRSGDLWSEMARLTPLDARTEFHFGQCIAIDDSTAVVGARGADSPNATHSGAAYVFVLDGNTWFEQAKLTPALAQQGDAIGRSVAILGDTAIVGADGTGPSTGAVYVFTRDAGVWEEQATLTASDGNPLDSFGYSVALQDDIALVGAPMPPANDGAGAAYVFVQSEGGWTEHDKLTASDGQLGDQFGSSVAIDARRIIVGDEWAGSTYVFTQFDGPWTEQSKITVTEGPWGGLPGPVAVAGDTAFIGNASYDAPGEEDAGAAYIFDLHCTAPCYADCDQSTTVDLFDFLCFTNAFNTAADYADCTADGVYDLFDFLCFVNAFNQGC